MPKLVQYREQCIGCGICQELQPDTWRMSKKDGKASLLYSIQKKNIHIVSIHGSMIEISRQVIAACPAKVIKLM
jgi:ferredoxin